MFIRTSLSIVFLKCSASSVPVGHGGTNCPSGRFDLPVGLAVFVSLGSPVRGMPLTFVSASSRNGFLLRPPFHFRFPCKFVSWRRRVPGAGGSLRGRVGRKRPAARAAERDEVRTPHPKESRGEGIRLQSPH